VKRIHRNSHVIVEPCNRKGIALGPQLSADARICAPVEHARINTLLNQKYGVMKRFIDVLTRLRGGSNTYDVIEITGSPDVRA
jgi:PPOX class probable F420-dependent enzyme